MNMKVRIMTEEIGVLSCQSSSHVPMEFTFPVETLMQWYPLDLNYEYRYNPKTDRLYLIMTEKELTYPSYGVTDTIGRVTSKKSSFRFDDWTCPEVWEENNQVLVSALMDGLTLIIADYTKEDIKSNKILIAELEARLRNKLDTRLKESMTTKEQHKAYAKMDWEAKDIALFKVATEEELSTYRLYGKYHVMCELMRRVLG